MKFDIWKAVNTAVHYLPNHPDNVVKLVATGIEAATFNEACDKAATLPGVVDCVNYYTPGNNETGFNRKAPRLGHRRLYPTKADAENPDGFKG